MNNEYILPKREAKHIYTLILDLDETLIHSVLTYNVRIYQKKSTKSDLLQNNL
jgi:hypothetical protein